MRRAGGAATRYFLIVFAVTLLLACGKKPPPVEAPPLTEVRWEDVGTVSDDMEFRDLEKALQGSLGYYEKLGPKAVLRYGGLEAGAERVSESLESFQEIARDPRLDSEAKKKRIRKEFAVYKSAGRDGKGSVLFTGYYEPWLAGRRQPDGDFCFPIYRRPSDLVTIDLSAFPLAKSKEVVCGRVDGWKVLPYWTREEIDGKRVLAGKGLELLYFEDPVDVFFLQIQGSGMVTLEGGEKVRVQYDGKNCHPYVSLGRYLIEQKYLEKGQASMPKIRAFLAARPEERQRLLNVNPSYTFFRLEKDGPFGNIGVPLTPWRSIATDARIFPKGALCLIRTEKPVLDEQGNVKSWASFSRFVLNQDTGGAITGPGRVDLFCGGGPEAEATAGNMQQAGELYFLLKRN